MSELFKDNRHEIHSSKETFDIAAEVKKGLEKAEKGEQNEEDLEQRASAETIRKSIEATAVSGKEMTPSKPEKTQQPHSFGAHAKLKLDAYKKLLSTTREQLPKPEQYFSSFAHKPVIETVSEVASKTVARPVGIAWGSLLTFIGVSVTLFLSYRYGFTFNYLLFVLFFIGGYTITTVLELSYKLLSKRLRH